jgi:hypothetical protein
MTNVLKLNELRSSIRDDEQISFRRLLGVEFLPVSPFPVLMDDPPEDINSLVSPIIYDKGSYIMQ